MYYTPIHQLLETRGLRSRAPPNETIAMGRVESGRLLDAMLQPTTRTYVEWGSGGSTALVSELIVTGAVPSSFRAFSIESSTKWMDGLLARSPQILQAMSKGQLKLVHGDMGATGFLGYPRHFNPDDHARALGYVRLDKRLGGRKADLVLVDGRFRLACMIEALAHLHKKAHRAPVLLLHDYMPQDKARASYDLARAAYDFRYTNGTLATLTPKATVSRVEMDELLEQALGMPI